MFCWFLVKQSTRSNMSTSRLKKSPEIQGNSTAQMKNYLSSVSSIAWPKSLLFEISIFKNNWYVKSFSTKLLRLSFVACSLEQSHQASFRVVQKLPVGNRDVTVNLFTVTNNIRMEESKILYWDTLCKYFLRVLISISHEDKNVL